MSVYLQRQAIFGYAKMNDIKIVRFFADHACVLEIEMCPGLSDALEYIARGKASALVVAGLTRLTISVEDLRHFVSQQRFLQDGPALISVNEQLDTRTAEGRFRISRIDIDMLCGSKGLQRGG